MNELMLVKLVREELHAFRNCIDRACDALNDMDTYTGGCMSDVQDLKLQLNEVEHKAIEMYNKFATALLAMTKEQAAKIKLHDNGSGEGGISHYGETLDEFIEELDLAYGRGLDYYNKVLDSCGICPVTVADLATTDKLQVE